MGERPLTQMQAEALRAVAAGEVKEIRCGFAAFRIFGASPTVIGRLRSMGLIEWTKIIGGEARLTDAGRSALSKAEGRSLSSASGQEGGE